MGVGKRSEKHRVYDTEQSSICSDAQCQGEQRHKRESRRLCQHANAVPYVLRQPFERAESPHFARRFLYESDVSKFPARRLRSLPRGFAEFHAIVSRHLQMAVNFSLEIIFVMARPERAHASPPLFFGFRTAAMAPESCAHRERSEASCRRPAAVRR